MIRALWLGRVPYLEGLHAQELLYQKLRHDILRNEFSHHYLCLMEHPPSYTVGLRSQHYSQEEEQHLRNLGAEFHRVQRGGLITFHGPGQLVAYPIFNLRSLRVRDPKSEKNAVGVRRFVSLVEEVIIQLLESDFGIAGVGRTCDTGVWVGNDRKIAAIGIQVRHGVTSHGLALNCDTDLGWYKHIVPCGIEGKTVTSIEAETRRKVAVEEVLPAFCRRIESVFCCPTNLRSVGVSELVNS